MPKKNNAIPHLLIQAPWWASALLASIVYLLLGQILPAVETTIPLINMVFKALAVPAPMLASFILLIAPFSFFNSRRKAKQLDTQRNIESIRQLHWRNFEELVAEAYRRRGYRVIEGSYGADGGIDLELMSEAENVLVQCKQWKSQKVGVSVAREMFGILSASNADRVIIICSGNFTQEAIGFANGKPIELVNGKALLDMVKDVQKEPIAQEPSIVRVCPKCGGELVERMAIRGANKGNQFLGCSNFPKCRHTQPIN